MYFSCCIQFSLCFSGSDGKTRRRSPVSGSPGFDPSLLGTSLSAGAGLPTGSSRLLMIGRSRRGVNMCS